MDNTVFIDKNTFEIKTDADVFTVDKQIAEAISELNKKGYKTLASCSGHYYQALKSLYKNCDIDFLEQVKKDPLCIVEEVRCDNFDYWQEHSITSIYIMFDKKYEFLELPENFEQEVTGILRCDIEFFNKDKKRKKEETIINEINKYNEILRNWAKKLPLLERKDD